MNQREFFEKVLAALKVLDIPYMITGSVGAIIYGEPRLTNDMDVVVELPADKIDDLSKRFPSPDFYFPPPNSIRDEISRRGQFNIIHVGSGSKVDLIIRKATEFARTEFARKQKVHFSENLQVDSATPEDIIISKLRYFQMGGSPKHLLDIEGILRISGKMMDREYLQDWIGKLGLGEEWMKVRKSWNDGNENRSGS